MNDAWDGAFKEAFESESILDAIERNTGVHSRILLRDVPGDATPVLKLPKQSPTDRRYRVLGEIARGGVGVVYKAHDKDLGRNVALKVIRADHAERQEIIDRFTEEAQIGGQLQHPGVVPVYGVGHESDGRPFFAMKLVKGRTLSALLEERKNIRVGRRRLIALFERIAQTMAYAHARGVIHRDLKPANIMVGAFGEVQVMDWGFAKVLGHDDPPPTPDATIIATVRSTDEGSHSIAGSVMGTPAYMPPEQALGRVDELNERCDVFALGAILCEILTGKPPYVGEPKDLLVMAANAILDGAWKRLDACGADEELIAATKKCLSPAAHDRPEDALHVARFVVEHQGRVEERAREQELLAAEARVEQKEQQARLAGERLRAEEERAHVQKERATAKRERMRAAKQRRAAEGARKARRATIVIAAILLIALGAGSYAYMQKGREEDERIARLDAVAGSAIQEARELEGAGQWAEALAAAKGAVHAAADAGPAMRERAQTLVRRVRAAKAAADKEHAAAAKVQALLDRLAEVPTRQFEEVSFTGAHADYARIFRKFGVDVEKLAPAAIAKQLAKTGRAVELAAVFDHWALMRRGYPMLRGRDWKELAQVARALDPDPLRDELRAASFERDRVRLLRVAKTAGDLDVRTRYLLGSALSYVGETEEAIRVLREARERFPDNLPIGDALVWALRNSQPPQKAEALRIATAMVAGRANTAATWVMLAQNHLGFGDYEGAERAADRASALDPDLWWVHDIYSYIHGNLQRWDQALAAALKAHELCPEKRVDVQIRIGGIYAALEDREQALKWFRQVQKNHPESGAGYFWVARWLLEEQDDHVDEAIPLLQKACELLPESTTARGWLSFALDKRDRYDEALRVREEALAIHERRGDPECKVCMVNYAGALRKCGRIDEAGKKVREVLELDDEFAGAHSELSTQLFAAGRKQEAFAEDARAIQLNPTAPSYTTLGAHLNDDMQLEKAAAAFQNAVRLQPGEYSYWCNLAQILAQIGKFKEAMRAVDRATELNTSDTFVFLSLGVVRLCQGEYEEAVAALEEALRVSEHDERWTHVALGVAYLELGRYDETVKQLSTGIDAPVTLVSGSTIFTSAAGIAQNKRLLAIAKRLAAGKDAGDPFRAAIAAPPDEALKLLRKELAVVRKQPGAQMRLNLWDWRRDHRLAVHKGPGWTALWAEVDALLGRKQ